MARKMREQTALLGRPVTQQVWVIDARNISLSPSGGGPKLFQTTTKQDSTYYPERLGYMFIINAPFIFRPLWAMIKPWLDPNTANKIQVLGSNYQDALKAKIPEDQIPLEYGGTAKYRLPGRPDDWSDIEDDDHENGYHALTLGEPKGNGKVDDSALQEQDL